MKHYVIILYTFLGKPLNDRWTYILKTYLQVIWFQLCTLACADKHVYIHKVRE